jgi:hypothetical protein
MLRHALPRASIEPEPDFGVTNVNYHFMELIAHN